jgi:hypothetical protein
VLKERQLTSQTNQTETAPENSLNWQGSGYLWNHKGTILN